MCVILTIDYNLYENMNFKALKWMIDSLVKTYKCPECAAEVSDNNVDVIGAAGSTINIDVECPNCGKHSMIKSEVVSLDLSKSNITPQQLQTLQQRLSKVRPNIRAEVIASQDEDVHQNTIESIKDEEIVDLNDQLKSEDLNVSDLFDDSENKLDN